jgi:hypothetical protein
VYGVKKDQLAIKIIFGSVYLKILKSIVAILFVSFFDITVLPLVYLFNQDAVISCDTECCMDAKEEPDCGMEDMKCPKACTPVQCVLCCFLCPVSTEKITVHLFGGAIPATPAAALFLLPDFHSECWQPPELA